MGTRVYDLNDVRAGMGNLSELLGTIFVLLMEQDFGQGKTGNEQLDRVTALTQIAWDITSGLTERMDAIERREVKAS